ncbi:ATPase 9, plasma membrane-type-like [Hordeum vulgare]|nr:ATPase 9, plasma membrane-type-like [Hordeum vulgare]
MATAEEMAELETVDEEEVLRRLATGLTAVEAPRRLRLHGPNVVARPHHVRALSSPLSLHPLINQNSESV